MRQYFSLLIHDVRYVATYPTKRPSLQIDEIRQAQAEMHEMAVGLQQKNAILRNELRHLKRDLGADPPRHHRREASSHNDAGDRGTRNPGSWR